MVFEFSGFAPQVLQFALSNCAKTLMFVHIAPEEESAGESLSTLNFASRVSEITLGTAKKTISKGDSMETTEKV